MHGRLVVGASPFCALGGIANWFLYGTRPRRAGADDRLRRPLSALRDVAGGTTRHVVGESNDSEASISSFSREETLDVFTTHPSLSEKNYGISQRFRVER